jgi:hypothetical protein
MNNKHIITVTSIEGELLKIELFTNFKKACEAKSFPYHSLKMLKFPIIYKAFTIKKEFLN